jgi:hypothetical protein
VYHREISACAGYLPTEERLIHLFILSLRSVK